MGMEELNEQEQLDLSTIETFERRLEIAIHSLTFTILTLKEYGNF